jgi:hypothetical protein
LSAHTNLAEGLLGHTIVVRRIYAISSIFSLLVLSWVLVRAFAPLNCINSTFIDKINIVSFNGEVTQLNQCSFSERVQGPIITEKSLAHQVILRTLEFEKVRLFWPPTKKKMNVEIVSGPEDALNFEGQTFRIHVDRLKNPDQFEKGLLTILSPSSQDPSSLMTREVLADFFWTTSNSEKPQATRPWLTYFQSLSSYCRGDEHLISHGEFCGLRRQIGDGLISSDHDSGAVTWSFLPLLTNVLKKSFHYSSLNDQYAILDRAFFLSEWIDEDLFDPSVTSLAGLELRFRENVADWLKPLGLQTVVLDRVLAEFSLFANRQYHYVILGDDQAHHVLRNPVSGLIFEHSGNKYFSPSDVPMNLPRKEILSQLPIQDIVFVGCEWPSPRELLKFSSFKKNVFFIKSCEEPTWKWLDLVKKGPLELAKSNPQVHFVEFNLRSLQLAQRVKGPFNGSSRIEDWKNWLGWQDIATEDKDQLSRPVSNLEGISRFRLSDQIN